MRWLSLLLMAIAASSQAAEVKMSVGLALPPYVIADENRGMELDIVRAALEQKGHTLSVKYVPFMRVKTSLEEGKVDAAMTVNESSGLSGVHYSDVHMTYQNVAIGLEKNGFNVAGVTDLGRFSIIAFQDATKYLGKEFAAMAKSNSGYKEMARQEAQIKLLFAGRTQLVVMDRNIFTYYRGSETSVDVSAPVSLFEVFPPTDYKVAFGSAAIRDDFNAGLAQLKSSGRYQQIMDGYLK
ncbi:polar amino acid ABC transporter [Bacterioplanes sanyensis]|uniref:substrate-binding periplasmic protein n=1 Tax=Bacterioplanes sanyensis TaxID=1249553 RepID=UPI0016746FB9|nr:transporter substrate-binding domain-containing protein [Bacterioplanes sanyensis]GGY58841.1 polar amino acid ABC transporter [Bacterioplanes sanyensis]